MDTNSGDDKGDIDSSGRKWKAFIEKLREQVKES